MKLTRTLLLAVLFLVPACAAAGNDDIRLPQPAVVPQPMPPTPPAPSPGGVVTLAGDELYVIDSSVDAVVRSHPRGLIRFEKKKPGTFYAKFAGGGGKVEEKEFAGPFVWVGVATGKGRVTLDVIPKGLKDESEIATAAADVDAGKNGCPDVTPPGPTPPGPKPPAPEPVKSFKVIIVYESGDTPTAAQQAVLFGKQVEDYLAAKCTGGKDGWGRRDKDADPATDTTGLKDLWAAVKPKVTTTPALAIAVNEKVTLEPLPATPADAVALLEKYRTGGK